MKNACCVFIFIIYGLVQVISPTIIHNELYQELEEIIRKDEAKTRAEEKAGLFEGDIEIDESTQRALTSGAITQRDAVRNRIYRWPNGVLYYKFGDEISNSLKHRIHLAMRHMEFRTCIRFKMVPDDTKKKHVKYIRGSGCYSRVGRDPTPDTLEQVISIGEGCERLGTIVHESMHSLGFFHEQSRTDRDKYVKIKWGNIMPAHARNFNKYPRSMDDSLGKKYDYHSLMHYSKHAFAIDRDKPTIVTLHKALIGQRFGLSHWDVYEINKLYNCHEKLSDEADPFACIYEWHKLGGLCTTKRMRQLCAKTCLHGRLAAMLLKPRQKKKKSDLNIRI